MRIKSHLRGVPWGHMRGRYDAREDDTARRGALLLPLITHVV